MPALSLLHQAVAPPSFADEQKTRLAVLLHHTTLGLAVLAALYVILSIIFAYNLYSLIFGFAALGLCLLMNIAGRRGYVRAASIGLAASLWLTLSLAALLGGGAGVFDASFNGYIIPIILAAFFLGGRAGMTFAVLSIAAGGVILAVQVGAGAAVFSVERTVLQWIATSVLFVGAAYLLALTRSSLMDALRRAQTGERDLAERNAELRREVAQRQRVEDTLRGQYDRLRGAFSAAGLDTWIWDARQDEVTYPDTDPTLSKVYPKDLQSFLSRVHPDDRDAIESQIRAALAENGHYEAVYRFLNRKTGGLEWYFAQGDAYFDADGRPAGIMGASIDITRRKVAEEGLHASEAAARAFQEKLKTLHEVSVELAQTTTLDELYRQVIQLGRNKLGFSRLGLFLMSDEPNMVVGTYGVDTQGQVRSERDLRMPLGTNNMLVEALHNRSHVAVRHDTELWDYSTVTGRGWNALALLWNETNAIGWLASDNLLDRTPLRDDQLELLSLYGSFLGPLILKKQAEMQAQRHQERLRLALKAAQMRTWNWNLRTGEIISDELEKFNLRTVTRIDDFYRQVDPADHAAIKEALRRAFEENMSYSVEYRVANPNGGLRWVSSLGQVYRDEDGTPAGLVGVSQDINERKQAEERFFKAFHGNPSAIAITLVEDGRYIEVNRIWCELLGYSREETIGHTSIEVGFIDSLETRQQIITRFNERGYLHDMELLVGGKDGKKVLVLMQAEQIDLGGQTCFLTMLQDISGRKEVEKQALELALQKERVALLTEFIGNVSHDIKTPLTAINTSLYLLERIDDPDKQREKLDTIRTQARLLEKFIQDILTISRLDYAPSLDLKPVALGGLLADVVGRLRPSMEKHNLVLTLELDAPQTPVWGDESELDRVLVNLVENAVTYTPSGGSVRVRSFIQHEQAVIEVIDTGIGIAPADIPGIFTRFYRAEAARAAHDTGTGLGLAIVQKIVAMHNGSIEVDSVVGKGSTFRVRLPVAP